MSPTPLFPPSECTTHARHAMDATCHVVVAPWRDPVVERVGFDACGDYVELFWLGILGPTATLLLRRLAITVVLHPHGFVLDTRSTAGALGLGADSGERSIFARSLGRLVMFGLARRRGQCLDVRTVVPPLSLKHLARLPDHLQSAHALWTESAPQDATALGYACGRPAHDDITSSVC